MKQFSNDKDVNSDSQFFRAEAWKHCGEAAILIEMAVMGTPDMRDRVEIFDHLQATLDEWRTLVEQAREKIA